MGREKKKEASWQRTIEDRLKRLAEDPYDPFLQRVRDRLGRGEHTRAVKALQTLVLGLPVLLGHIHRWTEDPKAPIVISQWQAFLVKYLHEPADLVEEEDRNGLFSFVDDAYLAAAIYQRTLTLTLTRTFGRRRHIPTTTLSRATIRKGMGWAQRVLPRETESLERWLNEVGEGKLDVVGWTMTKPSIRKKVTR